MNIAIGIIGGSGLYQMEGLKVIEERKLNTPFGEPSDPYIVGEIDGVRVAFLSRHGRGHRVIPSELNYRANIFGFKVLGVHTILSASAVGSMKEKYQPTDIVFPDQFIDRTRHRARHVFREWNRRTHHLRRSDLRRGLVDRQRGRARGRRAHA